MTAIQNRSGSTAGGHKNDSGKARYALFPAQCLREAVDILTQKASFYGANNWKSGLDYSRCYDALQRHLYAWWVLGEEIDEDTGKHHLGCAMCNIAFLLFFAKHPENYKDYDDRECKNVSMRD